MLSRDDEGDSTKCREKKAFQTKQMLDEEIDINVFMEP